MSNPRELSDTAEIELPPLDTPFKPLSSPPVMVDVEFGAISHPGKVRTNNEDHFLVFRLSRCLNTLLTNLPHGEIPQQFEEYGYAMVVADGMGGMAAGEVASRVAMKSGVEMLVNDVKWNLKINEQIAQEVLQNMGDYVRALDFTLTELARYDKSLSGMGTTFSVVYSVGTELFIGHVGDSRVYLHRKGKLLQLTRDHTVAQSLADAGEILPEEVATHKQRHVLTNALGGNAGLVKVDTKRAQLEDGDYLLLCTDGLSDLVSDDRIASVLGNIAKPQQACEKLIDLALSEGGRDNVTVVLARFSIPGGK